ncbi:pyrethroid hydrolase Ces2e-like [Notamacropus eugenii]|uniref:pyrethroid hydrolase Ces2e-like n=1 Tax=Notamacropus eugenii TaxID=9315 RepID=UPI003B674424
MCSGNFEEGKGPSSHVREDFVEDMTATLTLEGREEFQQHFKVIPGVVDGQFFPKYLEGLLAAGEFHHVLFIIDVNHYEFGWVIPGELDIPGLKEDMDKNSNQSTMQNPFLSLPPELVHLMMEEYLRDTEDSEEYRAEFPDMMGDLMLVISSLKLAKYPYSPSSPVYFYEFQHQPNMFKFLKPDFVKADHGDELLFIFGVPCK